MSIRLSPWGTVIGFVCPTAMIGSVPHRAPPSIIENIFEQGTTTQLGREKLREGFHCVRNLINFIRSHVRDWLASGKPETPNSASSGGDPQGRLALMLCESMLHVLVEEGALTKAKAIEAIETVADATREMANDNATGANHIAVTLIEEIVRSFAAKADRAPSGISDRKHI
jgi:hypothetical protein